MMTVNKILLLTVVFHIALFVKSEEVKRQGRDYHGYFPPIEEEKKLDYQLFPYPSTYYPVKEGYSECEKNPMLPLLGKGLNLLLLKLGIFGVIKAITALVFLGLLAKLPLIFLKLTFLKSFFLPFLVAPLLVHMFSNQMSPPSEEGGEEKPGDNMPGTEGMMGMGDMNMEMGRQLTDNVTSVAWESIKMFVESDQCVERISCIIGASNSASSMGKVFSRMLKFLHYSSPPGLQERMTLIREAYNKGSETSTCSAEDYKCQSPELLIQHGLSNPPEKTFHKNKALFSARKTR